MVRVAVIAIFVSLLTTACLTTEASHQRYIGPAGDRCLETSSDCKASSECCSDWCAIGSCAVKGGGS